MSANLPALTRALAAGLTVGKTANLMVCKYVMGWDLENIGIINEWTDEHGNEQCVLEVPGGENVFNPSWCRDHAARMEHRLAERDVSLANRYAGLLEWLARSQPSTHLKQESRLFLVATATALLRVKAALLLFCEE